MRLLQILHQCLNRKFLSEIIRHTTLIIHKINHRQESTRMHPLLLTHLFHSLISETQ